MLAPREDVPEALDRDWPPVLDCTPADDVAPEVGRTMFVELWIIGEETEGDETEELERVVAAGDGLCPEDVGLCPPDDGGLTTDDVPD